MTSLSEISAVNLIVGWKRLFVLEPASKKTSGDSHRVPSGCVRWFVIWYSGNTVLLADGILQTLNLIGAGTGESKRTRNPLPVQKLLPHPLLPIIVQWNAISDRGENTAVAREDKFSTWKSSEICQVPESLFLSTPTMSWQLGTLNVPVRSILRHKLVQL